MEPGSDIAILGSAITTARNWVAGDGDVDPVPVQDEGKASGGNPQELETRKRWPTGAW